ncbi:MAG: DUF4438 domain-containing protein [Deltaproteobacteria bacterium]|nr:DUF4438 domain-containing protein [Deltaproteobacteria bacterium]
MIRTNEKKLAKFRLQGAIMPPYGFDWELCIDGKHRMVPSVGGINLNFKVGDLANQLVGDHLEPAVSTTMEPGLESFNKLRSIRNKGYNNFSCIGNDAVLISGRGKGKKGTVTGHHGGCEHVIIDFDSATLDKLTFDDKILITAHGVGLEIEGFEDVSTFSLDPRLFKKLGLAVRKGKLEVPVATTVPAAAMGSGIGDNKPFRGDYDIQTSDPATNKKHRLNELRLGDLVAIIDHDSTHGWSFRKGAVSIGVVIHGDSSISGHGPGCQTIMTSGTGQLVPKITPSANIGRYLKLGTYRQKRR